MLARALAALMFATALVALGSSPSSAGGGQNCWTEVDPVTYEVKYVCEDQGGGPGGGGQNPGGGSSTCSYAGNEIPCTGPEGSVWNGRCYVGAPLVNQPESGPNGEAIPTEGRWHTCYLAPGVEGPAQVWVPVGSQAVDPVTVANRAIASMNLDPITIGIVPESGPDRVGLVGLPVWMWVEDQAPNTYGPITASASQGPVSVTATAKVSSIVWDMGDGTKVTCTGPGTPYEDRYGKQDSPTCGHRYEQMSDDQPDDAYQVTATSHWVVEWSGGGQSGTIELDITTEPLPIRIGEAQVLTQ